MNFIINLKGRKYTKEALAVLSILPITFIIILLTVIVNYKPVYKVTLAGKLLGYVKEQKDVEEKVNEYINTEEENIAFISLKEMPTYELKLAEKDIKTEENKVLEEIKSNADITYRSYAITLDGETRGIVESLDEAEEIVNEIKQDLQADLELDLGIVECYSENTNEATAFSVAKESLDEEVEIKVKEFELSQKQESTLNGIAICRPMDTGMISSRYGSRSSGDHTGLDICTSVGTPIHPVADGVVSFAGYKGSYGNLVIIDHGNGIQTYYAHCSSLYVNAGETVTIDDTIAAVGSTGNSTGPHLHLEIRINGEHVNPQQYVYK